MTNYFSTFETLLPSILGLVFGGGPARASALVVGCYISLLVFCFLSFSVFLFRRPGFGAQWFVAVAAFGVYVDGKGGLGFFPRDVLPWSGPLTVQIPVDDRLLTDFAVGSSGLLPWFARSGPLRVFPCAGGSLVLLIFPLFCSGLLSFNLVGALHLVPCMAILFHG